LTRSGNFRWSGVTVDCAQPGLVAEFWAALLGRELSVPLPGWLRLGTLDEAEPVINFQPVPEPKRDKSRMHFDIRVDDVEQAVDTVTRLGGRSLHQRYDYDEGTVLVMADPEGNEFCIVHYFGAEAISPADGSGPVQL
jgi:predicted enzyme related to lactoylglutathione lyase